MTATGRQVKLFVPPPEVNEIAPARNRCVICPSRADGPTLAVVDVDPTDWFSAAVAMRIRYEMPVDLFEVSPEGAWTLRDRMPHPTKSARAALARAWGWAWPKVPDTVRRIAVPHNGDGATVGEALHSPCGRYRYALARTWEPKAAPLVVVGLNPSIADAETGDPTATRIEVRARSLGYGGFVIVNLFAYVSTDPAGLHGLAAVEAGGPVGPRNGAVLDHFMRQGHVLAAWGMYGGLFGRDVEVRAQLRDSNAEVYVLAVTKDGDPRHPLYLPYGLPLVRWAP